MGPCNCSIFDASRGAIAAAAAQDCRNRALLLSWNLRDVATNG
jgi:hypothetical protein